MDHLPSPQSVCQKRDKLTGLWTRDALLSQLFPETDRAQRMGTSLAFLLLDLDGFSQINAQHGRDAGDTVLQELGTRFRRFMRSYDLLGRVGGDRFLMVLPGCNSEHAQSLATRVRTVMLRRGFSANGQMITVSASLGIAQSRGRSPLVVLREAEQAL